MTDYGQLLDDEIKAFVDKTLAFYPADVFARSVAENRETYDGMCAAFRRDRPRAVAVSDERLNGVATRRYRPAEGQSKILVLYFHGGGFVLGGLDSHDDVCAEMAHATALDLCSVDYRLCPENSRLDALADAQAVLDHTVGSGERVILAGDSAGGWLAAALAAQNIGSGAIAGQVLIYPGLGGAMEKPSMTTHAHAPLLSAAEVASYSLAEDVAQHSPLAASDFAGLPPTLALSAECDPLANDGVLYCEAIHAAGGQAISMVEPGLVHGHLRARHMSAKAARSFARVNAALSMLANSGQLDARVLEQTP